jgi:hypothetical protein
MRNTSNSFAHYVVKCRAVYSCSRWYISLPIGFKKLTMYIKTVSVKGREFKETVGDNTITYNFPY